MARPPQGRSHQVTVSQDVALWKARAEALQWENQQLHLMIRHLLGLQNPPLGQTSSITPHKESSLPSQQKYHEYKQDQRKSVSEMSEDESSTDEEPDNPVNEEYIPNVKDTDDNDYIRFVEETQKHQKERDGTAKKKFDFRSDTITDEILIPGLAAIDTDFEQTKKEMSILYGSKALRVHSVETQVQLKFDQWTDQNKPIMWPAMPLKIRR